MMPVHDGIEPLHCPFCGKVPGDVQQVGGIIDGYFYACDNPECRMYDVSTPNCSTPLAACLIWNGRRGASQATKNADRADLLP